MRRIRFDEPPPEGKSRHDRIYTPVTPTMAGSVEALAIQYDVSIASMAHVLLDLGLREALAEPGMVAALMRKNIDR